MVETQELESRIWSDRGTKPIEGDEVYNPGYQPIAAFDNWHNWAVTTDIHNLHGTVDGLDDVFVNTNLPDSVEQMQGPLGTPRVDLTNIETVEIFNDSGPAADTLHLRQRDGNDTSDNALVYERYSKSEDNLTEVFAAMDNGSDSIRYKDDELYREDHPVGTEDKPVPEGHYNSLSSSSIDTDELSISDDGPYRSIEELRGDIPDVGWI